MKELLKIIKRLFMSKSKPVEFGQGKTSHLDNHLAQDIKNRMKYDECVIDTTSKILSKVRS